MTRCAAHAPGLGDMPESGRSPAYLWLPAVEAVARLYLTRSMTPTSRKLPFTNVPREYWFLGPMQNLRRLAKMENGEYVPANKAREAEAMARKLRKNKQVVDLTYKGEPYIRDARPDELDQEGNIVNYFAKYPGLTDKEWRDLRTPEARGAASQRWRHES